MNRTINSIDEAVRTHYAEQSLSAERLATIEQMLDDAAPRRAYRLWSHGLTACVAMAATFVLCALLVFAYERSVGAIFASDRGTTIPAKLVAHPRMIAVKVCADWCADSAEITPTVDELTRRHCQNDVLFVNLDYTDEQTSAQANYLAEVLGIKPIIDAQDVTGELLLIDRINGRVLQRFHPDDDPDDMSRHFQRYLSAS